MNDSKHLCHEPLLWRLPLDSSYVVFYCSPTRYCPFPFPLFPVPAPRAYCTSAYCHVHVYSTVPLLPGDLSFDLLSPGKPSCISLCTYFAQYIHLSPVLSVELCSSLYCSQSAGAPACLALGSSSLLDSSRNMLTLNVCLVTLVLHIFNAIINFHLTLCTRHLLYRNNCIAHM